MRTKANIDYVGFSFNGIHCSQFGLYRVANGDRYSQYLSPQIANQVVDVNGVNGQYYFGSKTKESQFDLNLAFNDITELELRGIYQWVNSGVGELIFDEVPYKKYFVTLANQPQFSYIPFIEQNNRVYKGEMTLSFINFDGYGYSVNKWSNQYSDENEELWLLSSKLVDNSSNKYDKYNSTSGKFQIYNAGDLPCDFLIELTFTDAFITDTETSIQYLENTTVKDFIKILIPSGTKSLKLDTQKNLIYYNNIQNNAVIDGDFFKIPVYNSVDQYILITPTITLGSTGTSQIKYAYKYWG